MEDNKVAISYRNVAKDTLFCGMIWHHTMCQMAFKK
jgi:hypothetical protein